MDKETGMLMADTLMEIPFDWKAEVPLWGVYRFMEYRADNPGAYMTGWKATPKGGKLTTYDPHWGVVTNQFRK